MKSECKQDFNQDLLVRWTEPTENKKSGNKDKASENLKEAYALTGMDNDSFIGSQPFKDHELTSKLKSELSNITV